MTVSLSYRIAFTVKASRMTSRASADSVSSAGQVIRLKLQSCECCQAFYRLSTVAPWQLWFFWTCQRHCRPVSRSSAVRATFGIDDIAHRWIRSYLSSRHHYVRRGSAPSSTTQLVCGVPQGSILVHSNPICIIRRGPDIFDRMSWATTSPVRIWYTSQWLMPTDYCGRIHAAGF